MSNFAAAIRYGLRQPLARSGSWMALGVSLAAIGATVFWWPEQQRLWQLESRIQDAREEIVQARRVTELSKSYRSAADAVSILDAKLSYAATQAQQVTDVTQAARKRGVSVLSQAYEERGAVQGRSTQGRSIQAHSTQAHSTLSTELTVQGSYRAVAELIADLPRLPSWTEVQEVSLERMDDNRQVKGRIRLITYRATGVAR